MLWIYCILCFVDLWPSRNLVFQSTKWKYNEISLRRYCLMFIEEFGSLWWSHIKSSPVIRVCFSTRTYTIYDRSRCGMFVTKVYSMLHNCLFTRAEQSANTWCVALILSTMSSSLNLHGIFQLFKPIRFTLDVFLRCLIPVRKKCL